MNIINTDIVTSANDVFWQSPAATTYMDARPVLVVSSEYAAGSAEEEQLTGILGAGCRLLTEQYNIITLAPGQQMPWHKLREQLQPNVVLLFNVSPQQLGISALFRLNEINRFDGAFWAPTLSLTQVMQDKALKGQIWNNALKPLFVDKVKGDVLVKRA